MTALPEKSLYTVEDVKSLPEGERAELINGVMYDMAAPSVEHQRLSMFLSNLFYSHIRSQGGNCEVFAAPFAVYIEDDDYNYVEPDLSVICDPSKLGQDGCHGAPDLIIEIVSNSTASMDYVRKLIKYRDAGVREYWIVNPMREAVNVYRFGEGVESADVYRFKDAIPCSIFPGLEVLIES